MARFLCFCIFFFSVSAHPGRFERDPRLQLGMDEPPNLPFRGKGTQPHMGSATQRLAARHAGKVEQMPSQSSPPLGSLAIQAPSLTPQLVHVSPTTCHNLSLFKGEHLTLPCVGCGSSPEDLLREYRRLDDTITMRLNRSNAQFRDRDRQGLGGKGSIQDRACAYIWKELVGELLGFVSLSQGALR